MRRLMAIALLLALPLCAGCGNRSLVLTVDILSFMDTSSRSLAYGPIPLGFPTDTVDVFSDSLNLLQGIGDVTQVASASLKIGAQFDNASGAADARFLVYISSADSTDPFTTTPVADIPVQLLPGQITTVNTEIASSPALADALTHDKAKVGVQLIFSGTSFPIQGVENLTQLTAVVVTKKDF